MPNALTATGLILAPYAEWQDYFSVEYRRIYGTDINLGTSTPDGQLINVAIQAILDVQDLMMQVYNTVNPDNAIGVVLDQRVAINGIQRQGGTYTITPITAVVSESVNLYGLDQSAEEVFTVSDNAGNEWYLTETQLGLAPGSHVLTFRAAEPGAQLTIPNTITVPVTVVVGVESVNNPTSYTQLGINEESDAQLRVRRQRSVSLASQGYLAGLLASLENISGVTSAFVYENTGDTTDSDGIPGHSIWVIVAGTGADSEIAQAIYTKRNAGAGMYGEKFYNVVQVDGTIFTVYWDTVITRNIFIFFDATSIDGITSPNISAIRSDLLTGLIPGVYDELNINGLGTAVQAIDPNTLVTNAGFSDGNTQTINFSGVAASGSFKISYNGSESAAIDWDDSTSDIEGIIQAVPGLENTEVSGGIISQSLVFDLSAEEDVLGLIAVVSNSLQTSAPVAISVSYDFDLQNIIVPPSKRDQFILTQPNIVILPMILTRSTNTVEVGGNATFTGLGGYGAYVYSFQTNNSGGSIDSATGVYTAGATPAVTDTLKVTDAFGNTATTSISVV